jgi:hypothetical protein
LGPAGDCFFLGLIRGGWHDSEWDRSLHVTGASTMLQEVPTGKQPDMK